MCAAPDTRHLSISSVDVARAGVGTHSWRQRAFDSGPTGPLTTRPRLDGLGRSWNRGRELLDRGGLAVDCRMDVGRETAGGQRVGIPVPLFLR